MTFNCLNRDLPISAFPNWGWPCIFGIIKPSFFFTYFYSCTFHVRCRNSANLIKNLECATRNILENYDITNMNSSISVSGSETSAAW